LIDELLNILSLASIAASLTWITAINNIPFLDSCEHREFTNLFRVDFKGVFGKNYQICEFANLQ